MSKKDDFDAETIPLATMMEFVELELLMGKFGSIFGEMCKRTVIEQAKWKLFLVRHRAEFAKVVSLFEQGYHEATKGEGEKH